MKLQVRSRCRFILCCEIIIRKN